MVQWDGYDNDWWDNNCEIKCLRKEKEKPWKLRKWCLKWAYNCFMNYIEGVKLLLWGLFFCFGYYLSKMNVDNYECYKYWNKCSRIIYKISTLLLRWLDDYWNVISWEEKLEWII